jgi:hypothetical protein
LTIYRWSAGYVTLNNVTLRRRADQNPHPYPGFSVLMQRNRRHSEEYAMQKNRWM